MLPKDKLLERVREDIARVMQLKTNGLQYRISVASFSLRALQFIYENLTDDEIMYVGEWVHLTSDTEVNVNAEEEVQQVPALTCYNVTSIKIKQGKKLQGLRLQDKEKLIYKVRAVSVGSK